MTLRPTDREKLLLGMTPEGIPPISPKRRTPTGGKLERQGRSMVSLGDLMPGVQQWARDHDVSVPEAIRILVRSGLAYFKPEVQAAFDAAALAAEQMRRALPPSVLIVAPPFVRHHDCNPVYGPGSRSCCTEESPCPIHAPLKEVRSGDLSEFEALALIRGVDCTCGSIGDCPIPGHADYNGNLRG